MSVLRNEVPAEDPSGSRAVLEYLSGDAHAPNVTADARTLSLRLLRPGTVGLVTLSRRTLRFPVTPIFLGLDSL